MSFWENVDYVREFRNMTRKELAYKADFSINSISTGITRESFPSVDVACRIAKVLNVSVEFLVNTDVLKYDTFEVKDSSSISENEKDIKEVFSRRNQNLLKYSSLIEDFSIISPDVQKIIAELIHKLASEKSTSI